MSLDPTPRHLSSLPRRPWAIVMILVLMIVWSPVSEAVGAYADAVAVAALLTAWGSTAVVEPVRPQLTDPARATDQKISDIYS